MTPVLRVGEGSRVAAPVGTNPQVRCTKVSVP
jgi:hypothetical protein